MEVEDFLDRVFNGILKAIIYTVIGMVLCVVLTCIEVVAHLQWGLDFYHILDFKSLLLFAGVVYFILYARKHL